MFKGRPPYMQSLEQEDNNTLAVGTDRRLKYLIQRLELAHKGWQLSNSYTNSQIEKHLRSEGLEQQASYLRVFNAMLDELYVISQSMEFTAQMDWEVN